MNKRLALWGIPAAMWLVFAAWYTDLAGPLSEEEIAEAMALLDARGISSERREQLLAFLENDTGRQFLMVNNINMNENPPPMEGFGPEATAEDYNAHYTEYMGPALLSRACHPVFMGRGQGFAVDADEKWDTFALVRYRSRRSLIEIILSPEFGPRYQYKLAAITKTVAYPVESVLYLSDLRLLLFLFLGFTTALLDLVLCRRSVAKEVTDGES